jgi:hypothetical protein
MNALHRERAARTAMKNCAAPHEASRTFGGRNLFVQVAGGFGAFFDDRTIGRSDPLVGKHGALTIGGLKNNRVARSHFGVAGAVRAPRDRVHAAGRAAGFEANFFSRIILEQGADRLLGTINDGVMIPGDEIEPAAL